ncbi:MAG: PepSY domain-containing protein [Acidobacteria bacterium]|nr:PepSY domain-containing protein [Acidobacteriota bacterium]
MGAWQQWVRRPRTLFVRKASFQVHLWIGIAVGLYVVLLSVTGSALVFRRELDRAFRPQAPLVDAARPLLSKEQLTQAALAAYPGATVERVGGTQRRMALVRVVLHRNGETLEREFNAYTGADLGEPFPWKAQALLTLADLHDDLLMLEDRRGRFWNGVGSVLVTLLCLTGAVVWWPGIRGWRRAISVKWDARWPRLNFDLHSAMGVWFFLIVAIWAISGIYLAFPGPFTSAVDRIWGVPETLEARPGDIALEWLVRLHFGRWRSHTLKVVWVIIGLIPAAMFVTGFAMWWHRVVRRRSPAVERQPVVNYAPEPQIE